MSKISGGTSSATGLVMTADVTGDLELQSDGVTKGTMKSTGEMEAISFKSTVATGTAPLVVASTTEVANLNAAALSGLDIGQSGVSYIPYANASGNVLIGLATDSGTGKLKIAGQPVLVNLINDTPAITARTSDNSTQIGYLQWSNVGPAYLSVDLAQPLAFATTGLERMRITSGGNVLIGTTTDDGSNKLQVNGSASISTQLIVTTIRPQGTQLQIGSASETTYFPGNVLIGTTFDLGYKQTIRNSSGSTNLLSMQNNDFSQAVAGLAMNIYSSASSGNSGFFGINAVSTGGTTTVPLVLNQSGGNVLIGTATDASTGILQVAGNVTASAHNTYDLGTTAVRWKDVWCQTGAFNGSDARLKTEVRPFTGPEIEASKQLAREIGTYQWLESIAKKGAEKARHHVGMTVQKAIEIMTANGLDPFAYGFIGYDKWEDTVVHHDAVEAKEATDESPAIEAKEAYDEVVLKAGDAFSFRYDQLNQFIARGFEARLTALENA